MSAKNVEEVQRMYKPRVLSGVWPEQMRDPEFVRQLSEVELSEADIQRFAEVARPVPVRGCGCERRLRTFKEQCRDTIREYYRRKGHSTCECGRSVDESDDCRSDDCKYGIPRRRSFK